MPDPTAQNPPADPPSAAQEPPADAAPTTEGCAFCEIVAGRAPATIVQEWPDAIAFAPLDPVTDGHTLVVPREHVDDAVADPEVTAATMRRAAQLAAYRFSSNILTSVGEPATQSIFHLHIHVVPRAPGDWLMLPWGTAGDPHEPHWCRVAEGLKRELAAKAVAPTTAAPDAPGGHTALQRAEELIRARLATDADLGNHPAFLNQVAAEAAYAVRGLLVDPTFAQVWAAARELRDASHAMGSQRPTPDDADAPVARAQRLVAAERALAAAVDAAEAGVQQEHAGVQLTPSPADEGGTTEHDRRREWAAALRWAADLPGPAPDRSPGAILDDLADRIESGALTPWADQPDEPVQCACGVDGHAIGETCPATGITVVTPFQREPAPEPADDGLYEQLAAIEHQRWSDWQRYMHSLCERRDDGALVIPAARVAHWERQIATPYAELSEREKVTDREQVDRYWHLLQHTQSEPAGDGPGWDRTGLDRLLWYMRDQHLDSYAKTVEELFDALLAERDQLERERDNGCECDRGWLARAEEAEQERATARAELAEVTAERDRLQEQLDDSAERNLDLLCRLAPEPTTARPGDKLIVRLPTDTTREQAEHIRQAMIGLVPGVEGVVITAEQIMVQRGQEGGSDA